jgi:hypothetical protein
MYKRQEAELIAIVSTGIPINRGALIKNPIPLPESLTLDLT